PLDNTCIHQVIKRIVDRTQIRIDLLTHVARKKAESLAGFDGRARQYNAIDLLALKHLNCLRNREPGLASAGRSGPEDQSVALQRSNIGVLCGCAGPHRPLAQVDFLECRTRGSRVVVKEGALRDRLTNRTFDVTLTQVATALELLVKPFENMTRLLAGAPGA